MSTVDNMTKHEIYKAMKSNLAKAMKAGFYYQAIFIEYAIIEDRCASVLRHANVNYLKRNGQEIDLKEKLNKIRDNPAFVDKNIRKRISLSLIKELDDWREKRNRLIHKLASIPFDYAEVKDIAENGKELARKIDNSVRSVNYYIDKYMKPQTLKEGDTHETVK